MFKFLPKNKNKNGFHRTCGTALQYFLYLFIKKGTSTFDKFGLSQISDDSSSNAMTINKASRCSSQIVYDDFHLVLVTNTL